MRQPISTFVAFDLETIGLPKLQIRRTRITEICLVAVSRDHILDVGGESIQMPRVSHKLNLCVHPCKEIPPVTSKITGLYNELLEKEQPFNENLCDLLIGFLGRLTPPVCLVAHNGNKYDFPILQAELNKCGKSLPDDILCADSLIGFKEILGKSSSPNGMQLTVTNSHSKLQNLDSVDGTVSIEKPGIVESHELSSEKENRASSMQQLNERTPPRRKDSVDPVQIQSKKPEMNHIQRDSSVRKRLFAEEEGNSAPKSFKLIDIYEFLTRKPVVDSHRAECDVLQLMECIIATSPNFLFWSDENAIKFNVIKRLW